MKTVAFVCGLCIGAVGAAGVFVPAVLVWIAQDFVTAGSGAFYALSAVRIVFGLLLVTAAPASRVPRALRILGYVIVIAGITTALTAAVAVAQGQRAIDWWLQQGSTIVRITGLPIVVLGGFVAYACAPSRSAA